MKLSGSNRVVAAVALCGVAWFAYASTRAEGGSAMKAAHALVEAFNEHDAAAMAALVSEDFELYYVDDKGASELAVTGPEQLQQSMTGYFKHQPKVRSEVVASVDGPVYVSFREQIVGGQSSLAVYEVRDEKIKRVWYFPAE